MMEGVESNENKKPAQRVKRYFIGNKSVAGQKKQLEAHSKTAKYKQKKFENKKKKISELQQQKQWLKKKPKDLRDSAAPSDAPKHKMSEKQYNRLKQWREKKEANEVTDSAKKKKKKRQIAKKIHNKRKSDKIVKEYRKPSDPFPGSKPIPEEIVEKYKRGEKMEDLETRTNFHSKTLKKKEKKVQLAATTAARTELLMQEETGFLEADEGERTTDITQHDIAEAVDVTSAQKFFELKMNDFGPYRINYTRNGRFLLFGGAKGHVAAIDWMTKKLMCEMNVMETVNDVKWLHQETMYAVAQRQWTYIYDNQCIELHCLKVLDGVLRMEFLPYHFLLASASSKGYLSYIDVSVGQKVAGYSTTRGRLDVMCQNPSNAIVALGHSGGTVTMWCPKMREPVVQMLCHGAGVKAITVDRSGQYLATSGIDRTMKVWDLRTYRLLQSYKVAQGPGQLSFSQRGFLSAGMGNIVQVFKDCCRQPVSSAYLQHNLTSPVNSLQFCPYEDVLGVGHNEGFTSLITPGVGEPNFDALEANPYQTKSQRKEAEVKMLLEKIPADMIHLNTDMITAVDKKTLAEKVEENNKVLYNKPMKLEFEPRFKMKGGSKGAKPLKRKKGVIEEHKRRQIQKIVREKQKTERKKTQEEKRTSSSGGDVLNRFQRKS